MTRRGTMIVVLAVVGLSLVALLGPFERQRLAALNGAPVSSRGVVLDLFGHPDFVRDSMIGDTYAYRLRTDMVVLYKFAVATENASNRDDRVLAIVYAEGPDVDRYLERERLRPPGTPGPSRP